MPSGISGDQARLLVLSRRKCPTEESEGRTRGDEAGPSVVTSRCHAAAGRPPGGSGGCLRRLPQPMAGSALVARDHLSFCGIGRLPRSRPLLVVAAPLAG